MSEKNVVRKKPGNFVASWVAPKPTKKAFNIYIRADLVEFLEKEIRDPLAAEKRSNDFGKTIANLILTGMMVKGHPGVDESVIARFTSA